MSCPQVGDESCLRVTRAIPCTTQNLIANGEPRGFLALGALRKSPGIGSGYPFGNLTDRTLNPPSLCAMDHQTKPCLLACTLKALVFATALCASAAGHAQLTIAGFAIGQEMETCPPLAAPIRKDARSTGIACRFPNASQIVFGVQADDFSFATDSSGKIEALLITGIDAVQAAARATEEYGAPDQTEANERMSAWAWQREKTMLLIFHHPGEPRTSNIVLDRSRLAPESGAP